MCKLNIDVMSVCVCSGIFEFAAVERDWGLGVCIGGGNTRNMRLNKQFTLMYFM